MDSAVIPVAGMLLPAMRPLAELLDLKQESPPSGDGCGRNPVEVKGDSHQIWRIKSGEHREYK